MQIASDERFLGAREVRRRYGDISDMSLHRWLRRQELEFPKPIYIEGRRYWSLSRLEQWERARAAAA